MTEIYGSNDNSEHKYFVEWSNNSVTLKTGFCTEPGARHHARLIQSRDIGTVHSVTGPNGPVLNWETEGAPPPPRPIVWSPGNPVGGSSL
jgi:hypothetical protein